MKYPVNKEVLFEKRFAISVHACFRMIIIYIHMSMIVCGKLIQKICMLKYVGRIT